MCASVHLSFGRQASRQAMRFTIHNFLKVCYVFLLILLLYQRNRKFIEFIPYVVSSIDSPILSERKAEAKDGYFRLKSIKSNTNDIRSANLQPTFFRFCPKIRAQSLECSHRKFGFFCKKSGSNEAAYLFELNSSKVATAGVVPVDDQVEIKKRVFQKKKNKQQQRFPA